MAEQIYMCDVLFPEYRDGDDPAKYIKQTNDYLFLLREYLGYALDNLGVANFNAAQLGLLGDTITKPLNIRLDKTDEAVTSVSIKADGLTASLKQTNRAVNQLSITAEGISARLNDFNGSGSSIEASATKLSTTVSQVQTTAESAAASAAAAGQGVEAVTVRVSKVEQTAAEIQTTVSTIGGDYVSTSKATQTSDGFRFTVNCVNAGGAKTSELTFDKDGFACKYESAGVYKTGVTIDKDGLTIYDGKIRIRNNSNQAVFSADENGDLTMTGTITGSRIYGSFLSTAASGSTFGSYIEIYENKIASIYNGYYNGVVITSTPEFNQTFISLYDQGNMCGYIRGAGGTINGAFAGELYISAGYSFRLAASTLGEITAATSSISLNESVRLVCPGGFWVNGVQLA